MLCFGTVTPEQQEWSCVWIWMWSSASGAQKRTTLCFCFSFKTSSIWSRLNVTHIASEDISIRLSLFLLFCSAAGLPLKLCRLHWAAVPGPIQIPHFESNPWTVISHIKAAQWFIISEDFIFFFVCFSDCCLPLKYRYLKTHYVTFLDWNI